MERSANPNEYHREGRRASEAPRDSDVVLNVAPSASAHPRSAGPAAINGRVHFDPSALNAFDDALRSSEFESAGPPPELLAAGPISPASTELMINASAASSAESLIQPPATATSRESVISISQLSPPLFNRDTSADSQIVPALFRGASKDSNISEESRADAATSSRRRPRKNTNTHWLSIRPRINDYLWNRSKRLQVQQQLLGVVPEDHSQSSQRLLPAHLTLTPAAGSNGTPSVNAKNRRTATHDEGPAPTNDVAASPQSKLSDTDYFESPPAPFRASSAPTNRAPQSPEAADGSEVSSPPSASRRTNVEGSPVFLSPPSDVRLFQFKTSSDVPQSRRVSASNLSQITDDESQASNEADFVAGADPRLPGPAALSSGLDSKEPPVFLNSFRLPSHRRESQLSQATDASIGSTAGLLPAPPSVADTLLLASKAALSSPAAPGGASMGPKAKPRLPVLNWFTFDPRSRSSSAPVPSDPTAVPAQAQLFSVGDAERRSTRSPDGAPRKLNRSGTLIDSRSTARSLRKHGARRQLEDVPIFSWEGRRFLSQDGTLLGVPDELRRDILLSSYLLFSIVMTCTIAFPVIGPYTFFCTILSVPSVIAFLPNVDVLLAKTALRSFSTGYLFGNVALLCGCLLGASSLSIFSRIQIAYFFLLQTALTAGMDAADFHLVQARISSCVFLMIGVALLLAKNSVWDPLVNLDSVWFGYFMDARRLANGAALSCFWYAGRYMYNTLRNHFTGRGKGLCALRLPVRCRLERVRPDELRHFQSVQSEAARTLSLQQMLDRLTDPEGQYIEYVRLRTESISAFFQGHTSHGGSSQSPRPMRRLSADSQQSFASTHKTKDTVERSYLFCPVVTSRLLKRIANSKYYYLALSLVLLVCFGLSAIDPPPTIWICPLFVFLVLCFLACELTRFDRHLIGALFRNFEYWLVVSSIVLHCSFNLVWKRETEPLQLSSTYSFTLMYLVTSVVVYSLDAGPGYSYRLRLCVVSLLALSNFRVLLSDTINPHAFPSEEICFYYCASTRVLALSTMFTQAVFVVKFWLSLIRYKKRCILLAVGLEYCSPAESSPQPSGSPSSAVEMQRIPLANSKADGGSTPRSPHG